MLETRQRLGAVLAYGAAAPRIAASATVVGMRAIVLNGAVVESGALVAAGALVVEGTRVLYGEVRDGEFDDMQAAVRRCVAPAARHAALARPVGGEAR